MDAKVVVCVVDSLKLTSCIELLSFPPAAGARN